MSHLLIGEEPVWKNKAWDKSVFSCVSMRYPHAVEDAHSEPTWGVILYLWEPTG